MKKINREFTRKKTHEDFHRGTVSQYKFIRKDNFTYRLILEILEKYLRARSSVLDIGCGSGTLSFYLANKDHQVTGIDISEKAIKSCKKTAVNLGIKNANFIVMDFPNEIPKEKYDFIIFTEVLEHLPDDKFALRKIHSLLNPKGILFLTTPSINAPLHKLGLTKKFDKEVGHLRRYQLDELVVTCEKTGFKVLETKKSEGILRNFLFTNAVAGKLVRLIKFKASDIVTFLDNISINLFGESDVIIIAQKS